MIYRLRSSHEFELAGGSLRDHNIIKGNVLRSREPGGYDKSLSTLDIPPLPSVGSNYCRYCQTTDENSEKLIMPCKCQGTMAFVHLSCLTRWLNSVGRTYCELCLTRFKTETKRRFKLFESLVIWAQHPVNRIRVRTNLAIISLLAVFTGAMLTLGLMGMKHFINNDSPVSKTQVWMNSVVVSFMGVIVLGFWISIYLIARDELGPWYHWWTHCVNVNLILDDGPHPAA